MGVEWDPNPRAKKLSVWSFDHSSNGGPSDARARKLQTRGMRYNAAATGRAASF